MSHLDERIVHLETRLGEFNTQIEEIRSKIGGMESSASDSVRHQLEELQSKREKAESRLSELKLKDARSYEEDDISAGVIRIFDELGEKLDHLFSQIESKH